MKKTIDSEKLLERKLRQKIDLLGGWSIKLLATHVTGLPDRLCLFPGGNLIFVELKTTGQKTRKIQDKVHNRLRSMGFRVEVVDSSEGIEKVIHLSTH